jgi:3-hydroxybutyryl-CoA dehydrogenase
MAVAVVGAGLMGSGIAQVASTGGNRVVVVDTDEGALDRARASISWSLDRFVAKDRLSRATADAALEGIRWGTDLADCAGAELVVEAVVEDLEVKREVFARLEEVLAPSAVLATNTSAIPVTEIAGAVSDPARVVGTHFFSPVPMMELCELVRGGHTSDETLARARAFAESCGKTCIVVERDIPGFVANRLLVALTVEAARLVENGIASAEDVDAACRLGFGHPMGPLATADLAGIDVFAAAAASIYAEREDTTFLPPVSVAAMLEDGRLGRKSGRGFHTYPPD